MDDDDDGDVDCPVEDIIWGAMHAVIVEFDVGLGGADTISALDDSVSNVLPGNSVEYDGGGSISS